MATRKPRRPRHRKTSYKPRPTVEVTRDLFSEASDPDCVTFYCDGSCAPTNPGVVGWSFVTTNGDKCCGGEAWGTNNQAELLGVISSLKHAKESHPGKKIKIISDSQYAIRGCSQWMQNWKRNGWRTKTGDVKNVDLWKILDSLICEIENVEFSWVKGHNGNEWNELTDALAAEGRIRQSRVFVPGSRKPVPMVPKIGIAEYFGDDGLPGCAAEDFLW